MTNKSPRFSVATFKKCGSRLSEAYYSVQFEPFILNLRFACANMVSAEHAPAALAKLLSRNRAPASTRRTFLYVFKSAYLKSCMQKLHFTYGKWVLLCMPQRLFPSYFREMGLSPQRGAYYCRSSKVISLRHSYEILILHVKSGVRRACLCGSFEATIEKSCSRQM